MKTNSFAVTSLRVFRDPLNEVLLGYQHPVTDTPNTFATSSELRNSGRSSWRLYMDSFNLHTLLYLYTTTSKSQNCTVSFVEFSNTISLF